MGTLNLSKKEFRKQYSEYRKILRNSFSLGKAEFINSLNSNSIFREISTKIDKPVSVKIWLYKNC